MPSSPPTRPVPRVRPATLSDKDAWINTNITAYELDPQYTWRYPHRKEFPENAKRATGENFEATMKMKETVCLVAELPKITDGKEVDQEREDTEVEWVVVGGAVWESKHWNEVDKESLPTGFSSPSAIRRDMDPRRQKIFIDALTAAEKKHFGPELGDLRLVLADMIVDPKYHRRGAGKALMQYGMQKAKEENLAITLTASPLGRLLYSSLGFKVLGYVECGLEEEEEKVGVHVMVWVPEG